MSTFASKPILWQLFVIILVLTMVMFSPHGGFYPVTALVNYNAYIKGFTTLIKLRGWPLLVTRWVTGIFCSDKTLASLILCLENSSKAWRNTGKILNSKKKAPCGRRLVLICGNWGTTPCEETDMNENITFQQTTMRVVTIW